MSNKKANLAHRRIYLLLCLGLLTWSCSNESDRTPAKEVRLPATNTVADEWTPEPHSFHTTIPWNTNFLNPLIQKRVRMTGVLLHGSTSMQILQTTNGLIALNAHLDLGETNWGKTITMEGRLGYQPVRKVPDNYDPFLVPLAVGPDNTVPARYFLQDIEVVKP